MSDCANVEMRELLPDVASGTLDGATRARAEQHIAECADCASELETLRLVRSAFRAAPAVDVPRIVAALPSRGRTESTERRASPVRRWMDWRVAAALTTITIGALSFAVSQRIPPTTDLAHQDTASAEPAGQTVVIPTNPVPPLAESASVSRPRPASSRPAQPAAQLSFGGGVSDLDDASLRALLGALDEIDRAPVAPSAEPDRTPVLPVIKDGAR